MGVGSRRAHARPSSGSSVVSGGSTLRMAVATRLLLGTIRRSSVYFRLPLGRFLVWVSRDVRDTGSMGTREIKMAILVYLASILGLGVIGVASKYGLIAPFLARSSTETHSTAAPGG